MTLRALTLLALLLLAAPASAQTLHVGPGQTYTTIAAAAAAATNGNRIEIMAGTYVEEVVWSDDDLTIVGIGDVIVDMTGRTLANQGGKGIFILDGNNASVEGITFVGAHDGDGNGAGIRWQGGGMLTVRHCVFRDNEDGILGGNHADNVALIENNEFLGSGRGEVGYTHNLYINEIDTLTFRGNYSHSLAPETSDIGHLFKSRAHHNYVLYNRLTAEGSHSSYELQLPEGGIGYVIGNLIEQGTMGVNSTIISIGGDGMQWPDHHVFIVNNTIVNAHTGGNFINATAPIDLDVVNNLFIGPGTMINGGHVARMATNLMTDTSVLVSAATFDYHLAAGSAPIDAGTAPGVDGTMSLVPMLEYVHPHDTTARGSVGTIDIGAYEYGSAPPSDAGTSGTDAGPANDAGPNHDAAVLPGADAGHVANGDAGTSSPTTAGGCCGVAGTRSAHGALLGLALLGLAIARRRRAR
jgi:hypothetical protein